MKQTGATSGGYVIEAAGLEGIAIVIVLVAGAILAFF